MNRFTRYFSDRVRFSTFFPLSNINYRDEHPRTVPFKDAVPDDFFIVFKFLYGGITLKRCTSATLFLLLCLALTVAMPGTGGCFDFSRLINPTAKSSVPATASFEVNFSPSRQSEESIVRFIGEARSSVHVAAYSFTSREIAEALARAASRGIDIRVVVDKSNLSSKYTAATFLANQRVPVRVNSMYAIMHSKYIIVDGRSVETGSYNYSGAARDKNAENVLVIKEVPQIAAEYEKNWQALWSESATLEPRY